MTSFIYKQYLFTLTKLTTGNLVLSIRGANSRAQHTFEVWERFDTEEELHGTCNQMITELNKE